ncbi:unnamed protein product [Adineta ricciae]|uniref:Apple domain-containing protein n=1 Tax=Adineta ricciae TaxID=249248 RepID=A0A815B0M7_ADIRI|nr:unnamed protein product [Adineta ricciae]CAF1261398.1 unnamed protein product [Adineta ricciae]
MSCRLWLMLILIIFQDNLQAMTLNHLPDCFYEKRVNTTLQGHNDLNDHWTSDFDCFDRCLRMDRQRCRSFEYWHREEVGLCVRTNISLADYPSKTGHSTSVDYYEINCRREMKAVRPSTIHCPSDQLFLTVRLNGVLAANVQLGDANCKASWSNETHVQFTTNIDNCSLIITNNSIIGKLRWTAGVKDGNFSKQYERFFSCPSKIYQIRTMISTSTVSNHKHTLSVLPNPQPTSDDDQKSTSPYKISLKWTLHNHSYDCPETCYVSLYSFLNITLVDLSLITSKYTIDSCDLRAISPYTQYLQPKRLISQGCPVDPTVIHLPIHSSQLSVFYFTFYLYRILKEPIPFQIQCKILHNDEHLQSPPNIDCTSFDMNRSLMNKNDKRDYFYTLFRSASVYVTRQLPTIESEKDAFHQQKTSISIATVHYTECSVFALCILILYAV